MRHIGRFGYPLRKGGHSDDDGRELDQEWIGEDLPFSRVPTMLHCG
jgi:hypothetical protein